MFAAMPSRLYACRLDGRHACATEDQRAMFAEVKSDRSRYDCVEIASSAHAIIVF
jgi:hypothetical protein